MTLAVDVSAASMPPSNTNLPPGSAAIAGSWTAAGSENSGRYARFTVSGLAGRAVVLVVRCTELVVCPLLPHAASVSAKTTAE